MYTLLYILVGLVFFVFILSLIAPKTYDVFRAVEIARPKGEVFSYLRSLKNMDEWSPWAKKDPNMEKKFTETDGKVGSQSCRSGNKDVVNELSRVEEANGEILQFKTQIGEGHGFMALFQRHRRKPYCTAFAEVII